MYILMKRDMSAKLFHLCQICGFIYQLIQLFYHHKTIPLFLLRLCGGWADQWVGFKTALWHSQKK